LADYVARQLNLFFPDPNPVDLHAYGNAVDLALQRLEYCFKHSSSHRYVTDGETIFNHLYSDHYVMFLWFLSNTIWRAHGQIPVADKLYGLNKFLHGLDCTYATQLPDIFFLFHTVGTVLGKATYANFFVASQGCTIGQHNGKYPILGMGVALAAHASVIGDCTIGNRVSIGSNTGVFNGDVADDMTVYRNREGAIVHRSSNASYAQDFFSVDLRQIAAGASPLDWPQ
jgi:serine O-acetyltransferase